MQRSSTRLGRRTQVGEDQRIHNALKFDRRSAGSRPLPFRLLADQHRDALSVPSCRRWGREVSMVAATAAIWLAAALPAAASRYLMRGCTRRANRCESVQKIARDQTREASW